MRLPEGTISGVHHPVGDTADANCVILQEFGGGPGLETNQAIVEYVLASEYLRPLPMFVSGSLAKVLQERSAGENVVYTFKGPSAEGLQENLGTFGELQQFKDNRDAAVHTRPALVTNGHNVGNILRQAGLLGIDEGMIVPPNLPRGFDRRSKQIWTQGPIKWAALAPLRLSMLYQRGH